MSKEKMTIHRGLAELKLIDSRIAKAVDSIVPSGMMQKDKPVAGMNMTKEDFEKEAKAKMQSVTDLINRKSKIKNAIVKANAKTKVTVDGKTMTIADAINFKSVIALKRTLASSLFNKHSTVVSKINVENEKVNGIALENAKIMIGKEGDGNVKATDADVKAIVEPFVERNELHLVDPLNVEKSVEAIEQEVDGFELEIDAVLSEINAVTFIEI